MQKPLDKKYWPLYMEIAATISGASYAQKRKVGAVFVTPDGIMVPGYNGTAAGHTNSCESDGITLPTVIHAENNALKKFLNSGLSVKGSILFVTYRPCMACCVLLADLDIAGVVYQHDSPNMGGTKILENSGIFMAKYGELL